MPRPARNPEVDAPGQTAMPWGKPGMKYVPLEELSEEQILTLPSSAFTQDEWDSLDDEIQEQILARDIENDPKARARVEALVGIFNAIVAQVNDPEEDTVLEQEGEYLHQLIGEYDIEEAMDNKRGIKADVEAIAEELGVDIDAGSNEQTRDFFAALNEAVHDTNNWDEGVATYGYYEVSVEYRPSIYWDFSYEVRETDELKGITDEEIDKAWEDADSDIRWLADKNEIKEAIHGVKRRWTQGNQLDHTYEGNQNVESGTYAYAEINWEKIKEAMIEVYGFGDTIEPKEPPPPPEQRVIHRFKDGSYVVKLIPDELPKEGKDMGMCVGDPRHGYIKAARKGEIEILSLRTQAGRPKLTFEVKLGIREDPSEGREGPKVRRFSKPIEVVQIKGKSNRLPGWDLNKIGQGKVKEDEVKKAKEIVEIIGLDPNDVDDLQYGLRALDFKELDKDDKKENPRQPTPKRTFDMPYQP